MELRYRLNTNETSNITLNINLSDGERHHRRRRHKAHAHGHTHGVSEGRGHKGRHGSGQRHHHRHRHGAYRLDGVKIGPMDSHERKGGRRRRMMTGDQLKLVLMHLLREKTRHGYDLIREIEALSNGVYVPSAGVVYPSLSLLADMGRLTVREDAEGRKLFDLTDKGMVALRASDEELQAVLERLSRLGDEREKIDGGPVRRAMHNLKAALRGRLETEDTDRETLLKAAAIIDEAAGRIERL